MGYATMLVAVRETVRCQPIQPLDMNASANLVGRNYTSAILSDFSLVSSPTVASITLARTIQLRLLLHLHRITETSHCSIHALGLIAVVAHA
ncbi:hypothetical protein FCM35_KLT08362 [Carex littledalei]|uniref:Uncharacterized protein n=1 Tax=Carex littledalei TaxID=544730 RepID=A0A833QVY2_9POAL|nr:hypothetical protein FCM35_KLT08362 [Carex littledalei]